MNDSAISTEPAFEPFASSADGRRNSYTLYCGTRGQSMNYAACIWRQNVLAAPNVKTPEDWNVCGTACKSGQCPAVNMRREEELAGKSIYFVARDAVRAAASAVRQWVMPDPSKKFAKAPTAAPTAAPKAISALDAMGDIGGFADAITKAATEYAEKPAIASETKLAKEPATALPGESPLAMARRLAAQKQTT